MWAELVCYGAASAVIVTKAEIFLWLRELFPGWWGWQGFIHCPLCVGFWTGAFYWAVLGPRSPFWAVLGVGAASGCLALLFVLLWGKLEA